MRSTRRPRVLPPWLQRSLAAVGLAGLWAACSAWGQLLLPENLYWPLMAGPILLLLAALLRPWSLLMRLWQPLAPRFAAMGLLCPSPLVLLQRDALVQALGWSAAACTAAGLMNWLPPGLAPRLIGSTLEGLAPALSLAAALLVSLPLGVWLHGLPRRWARARLAGQCDGAATSDALALAANLMLLLPCLLALDAMSDILGGWLYARDATWLLLPALLACWALHASLRQWLAAAPPHSAALWLAVLPTDSGVRGGLNRLDGAPPLDAPTLLALAHQLAGRWQLGPVTVLLPDSLPASGEHLHAAQIAGRAAALFPTLPVQLADWQQTLPPPERWAALPLRELHLPNRWMAGAATLLLQPGDRLLVLACETTDVAAWQPLLLGRAGRVLRLGAPASADGGPAVAAGERNNAKLKLAALALLQPLRPQLEAAATAAGTDPPGEASAGPAMPAAAAAATRPGLGLPALPSLVRLGSFVGLSAGLLLAGFITLRLQLDGQADGVASAYAALRLQADPAAPAATAAVTPSAAGPASASALQGLLAPDIASGLLSVGDLAGRPVITLRADVLFEPGDAALKASAEPLLGRVTQALGRSDTPLTVFGYSDNQPSRNLRYPSNWALSAARATTVLNKLAEGVDRSRLKSAAGAADGQPVASNDTPAGRAANRRIEIVLMTSAPAAAQPAPSAATPDAGATRNTGNVDVPGAPPAAPANPAQLRAKKS